MPTVNVKLYHPQPYQRQVLDGLYADWQDSLHIVKAVRQCGKSMMLENLLIRVSLATSGQTSILISPTYKQGKKIYKSIYRKFRHTPLYGGSDGQDLVFSFVNGSEVKILSAEQGDNIRGETVTQYGVLVVDEAAYMKDDVYYAATPFTNVHRAPTIIVSTPRFRSGFFYDLYAEGMKGGGHVHSYDWAQFDNPYITAEKLEMYRKHMPLNLYRADYLGEWMEASSEVFGDFAPCLSDSVTLGGTLTAGLDWGTGAAAGKDSDSTALSIFNEHSQQVALKHWNDLDAVATIRVVCDALAEYDVRKLVVETNSIGAVYLDMLTREIHRRGLRCSVVRFTTTNDSKRKAIERFAVGIQNRTVQLLTDTEQKVQLAAFEMQRTAKGAVTYNAAKGYHDDIIMADAFALHGLTSAQYNIKIL